MSPQTAIKKVWKVLKNPGVSNFLLFTATILLVAVTYGMWQAQEDLTEVSEEQKEVSESQLQLENLRTSLYAPDTRCSWLAREGDYSVFVSNSGLAPARINTFKVNGTPVDVGGENYFYTVPQVMELPPVPNPVIEGASSREFRISNFTYRGAIFEVLEVKNIDMEVISETGNGKITEIKECAEVGDTYVELREP